MNNNRFTYSYSSVYGWCVYDKERGQIPAYAACCDVLLPVKVDESGTLCESPVMLKSKYAAMRLCMRLNSAYKHAMCPAIYPCDMSPFGECPKIVQDCEHCQSL